MLDVEAKAKPETIAPDREIAWSPDPVAGATPRRRRRLLPVLLTVLVAAAAVRSCSVKRCGTPIWRRADRRAARRR